MSRITYRSKAVQHDRPDAFLCSYLLIARMELALQSHASEPSEQDSICLPTGPASIYHAEHYRHFPSPGIVATRRRSVLDPNALLGMIVLAFASFGLGSW